MALVAKLSMNKWVNFNQMSGKDLHHE